MLIDKPGVYKNIPIEDYHRSKGISSSGIKLILDCPKKYWHHYLSGECMREEKPHFVIGQAVHTLALEPDTFSERYHVIKKVRRGTKAYDEAVKDAGIKVALMEDDYKKALAMATSVREHAIFKKIGDKGNIEDSILWYDFDTGAYVRTRPDFYTKDIIIDLKTTTSVSRHSFANSINEYGYHTQAAMQADGLHELTGIEYNHILHFCVESSPPHLTKCYVIDDESISLGRKQYKKGAALYRECLDKNEWPGYPEIIEDIRLPLWAYRELENE